MTAIAHHHMLLAAGAFVKAAAHDRRHPTAI
jgi:hypothetical protein